jgi:hypothetical protein
VLGAVALFELEIVEIAVALQRADPALLGEDHRHRLTRDERFDVDVSRNRGRLTQFSAALTERRTRTEKLARFLQLAADLAPLLAGVFEQALQVGLLFAQRRVLAANFHLFEFAQLAQARVEDRFGLRLVQLEACDQRPSDRPRCG